MEAAALFESFVRLAALFSAEPGTTRGELAMLGSTARGKYDGPSRPRLVRVRVGTVGNESEIVDVDVDVDATVKCCGLRLRCLLVL